MLQSVSKLGKEWWWEKWPETEPKVVGAFHIVQFLIVAVFEVQGGSLCDPESRHISPHPLVSPTQLQTSARECSLWQTSLDACSRAPDNRAALFLSPGMLPDKGKIKATPYCSKSSALHGTWPRKVLLPNICDEFPRGRSFSLKKSTLPNSGKEWKDLRFRRRIELGLEFT